MKKVIRLTEADLARIVKRVIKEQTSSGTSKIGRNNPMWINFVSSLKGLPYPPKVLTFNSYDNPPIPSQSLNWGTAKGPNGRYAMAITSPDTGDMADIILSANNDDLKHEAMHRWWRKKGYGKELEELHGEDLLRDIQFAIDLKNADKLRNDIAEFFKLFPPQ